MLHKLRHGLSRASVGSPITFHVFERFIVLSVVGLSYYPLLLSYGDLVSSVNRCPWDLTWRPCDDARFRSA
jgi:hypothetical protein